MKIKNVIAILVCLGVVAFACSTASALSLEPAYNVIVEGVDPFSASMQRLSSGFRINGAKDDASGLGGDVYTARFSEAGELVWERTFDGGFGNDDRFVKAVSDADDNSYVLVQSVYSEEQGGPIVLKYDPNGALLFIKRITILEHEGTTATDIAVSNDGAVYVVGYTHHTIARLNDDDFVISIDGNTGATRYQIIDSLGAGDDRAREIVIDSDGNFILGGTYYDRLAANTDLKVVKRASLEGRELWRQRIDRANVESWITKGGMLIDGSDNLYITMNYERDDGGTETYFSSFDAGGAIRWDWDTGDFDGDQEVEIADLQPLLGIGVFGGSQTGVGGNISAFAGVIDNETGDPGWIDVDEGDEGYTVIEAIPAEFSELYPGIVGIWGGTDDSGNGSKKIFDEEGNATEVIAEQPPERDLAILSDGKAVFLAGYDEGVVAISAFVPVVGGETKPVDVGTNVTVEFSEAPVSVTLANVFEAGSITVEPDPEGSLALPTYFEREGAPIIRIEVNAGYTSADNDVRITYDENDISSEAYFIILKSNHIDPVGGWAPPDDAVLVAAETNTVLVKVDDFSDFALGKYLDLSGAIQNLIYVVQSMNLHQGIDNSLDAKLENAKKSLDSAKAGNRSDAVNKLQAFINEVEAQSGGKLTAQQATRLVNEASAIIIAL